MKRFLWMIATVLLGAGSEAVADIVVFSAAGPDAAAITPTVNNYRNALGTLNPNNPGSLPSGRREINWDGVPDASSDPNLFPGNFFNDPTIAGRSRGVLFSTSGTGFLVSADSSNPTSTSPSFGFPTDFLPFSAERLFSPIGSNQMDIVFRVPGSALAATVSGFGAVFSDVETANLSSIQLFDANGAPLLGPFFVPVSGNGGLSFLGLLANAGEQISRVRLSLGDASLISNGNATGGVDTVVLDDFIYAEPQGVANVPEPSSMALVALGAVGLLGYASRKRRVA